MEPRLLSAAQAADRYAVSVSSLRRWTREKRSPCVRVSRRCVRYRVEDLDAYFDGLLEGMKQTILS